MKNKNYIVIIIFLSVIILCISAILTYLLNKEDGVKKTEIKNRFESYTQTVQDTSVYTTQICKDSGLYNINEGNTWVTIGVEFARPIFKCEYDNKTKVTSEKLGIEFATAKGDFIEIGELPKLGNPTISSAGGSFLRVVFCYEGCGGPLLVELDRHLTKVLKITNITEIKELEKYQLNDATIVVIQDKLIFIAPRHILELDRSTFKEKVLVEVLQNQMIGQESPLPAFIPEYAVLKEHIYYSVYADDNRYSDQTPNAKREYISYIEIK